jgi:predicted phage terminase large subunit-like protein
MQGNARVLAGDTFDPSWFQRGVPPERGEFERVVQFVDTAGGRDREKGDFCVILTLGRLTVDGKKHWWVLDVDRGRYSSLVQFDRVKWNAKIWEPNMIVVEDMNEGIALYDRLRLETALPIDKFKPTKDKEFRALPVASRYRSRRVWHPASDDGTTEKWVRAFEAELESFPNGPHDDQVDALSGAFNRMQGGRFRLRSLGG